MRVQCVRGVDIRLRLLVLVSVMADMHRRRAFFMPAVRCSRNPQGLQRQKDQQKNGEPAAHLKTIVGWNGCPLASAGLCIVHEHQRVGIEPCPIGLSAAYRFDGRMAGSTGQCNIKCDHDVEEWMGRRRTRVTPDLDREFVM